MISPAPPPCAGNKLTWDGGVSTPYPNCPSGIIVGGHVIKGKIAMSMVAGATGVYLIPICNGHNGKDNSYMVTNAQTNVLIMQGYNQP